jgi:hypothetical protein
MRIIFESVDKEKLLSQFQQIAAKYSTQVRQHDVGESHFIFVKSRIKISEKVRGNIHSVHVWGAKDEDLDFLKQFWGEPSQVHKERLTPTDFANGIADIPVSESLTKSEIIQTMNITEGEYNQFVRFIQRIARRPNAPEEMKRAFEILNKVN